MDLLQSVKEKNFGSVRKESRYASPNGEFTDSCNGGLLAELQGMNSGLEQKESQHTTPNEESAFDSAYNNPYDLG